MKIFTSNGSNLLLPLGAVGAEAARDCKSYPNSNIPNKYIYDVFLIFYLSILLLLFIQFLVFQGSESEIHQPFNSAILQGFKRNKVSEIIQVSELQLSRNHQLLRKIRKTKVILSELSKAACFEVGKS